MPITKNTVHRNTRERISTISLVINSILFLSTEMDLISIIWVLNLYWNFDCVLGLLRTVLMCKKNSIRFLIHGQQRKAVAKRLSTNVNFSSVFIQIILSDKHVLGQP